MSFVTEIKVDGKWVRDHRSMSFRQTYKLRKFFRKYSPTTSIRIRIRYVLCKKGSYVV